MITLGMNKDKVNLGVILDKDFSRQDLETILTLIVDGYEFNNIKDNIRYRSFLNERHTINNIDTNKHRL